MTNFGVKLFLESFLDYGLPPRGRNSSLGVLDPTYPDFTGFVFKLQANMDPKHRDRVAFVRVCTGKFEKDMVVNHARTGKTIRLSRPQKLFAQDRAVIEEAYPQESELHIVAHSLGTVILWDLLFSERFDPQDPAHKIRDLIGKERGKLSLSTVTTMGSPIPFLNLTLGIDTNCGVHVPIMESPTKKTFPLTDI